MTEKKLTKKERKKQLNDFLEENIRRIEDLPAGAKIAPLNHYDLLTIYYMIHSLLD